MPTSADLRGHATRTVSGRLPRHAVTLFELLLVLVLLVIAGSLAIPAVTGAFGGVRLRRAGDLVLSRWAEARAQAIETGAAYQFRFTPKTGKYRIEPWSTASLEGSMSSTGSANRSSMGRSTLPTSEQTTTSSSTTANPAAEKSLSESPTIETALPDPITFNSGQAAVEDVLRKERRVDALETPDSWSTPILFFPDGSASTATVVLENDANQYVRLTIRGLTGVARASNVMTREEFDKSSQTR